uniref:Major facilitator superfamily (MFS) profile domain-containing protein n=1 Tax=Pyramimonas obovata TaxID=1411642 RepID=A0A7S0MY60_9CHLO|mmetsp:Transcript_136/g.335  ORF Transcript_136/g.335 Transcript_136/m.335 type:complete len:482 (+) Transcript_136:257-1702(+)|eukprot:CAMPEP_0118922060 /NCGR_PEP_ID=MMETSP1169-20130426/1122_1 /TAXON_ID=36882 /ORGANISM="Pyramimonas obovata, Strain CCMP722" /LENGTH=481 /DNA_ID=CAMNT_0006862879 /DNA_START=233 /DNA_END=1678 /DNA_ORIENTATION=+
MAISVPPGVQMLINARGGRNYSAQMYRISVLLITFLVYTLYHATRKPPSIVKAILKGDEHSVGWAPFNGPDGNSLLGSIDVSFLAAYAIGMFFSGHLGDTLDLRIFLTWGMVGSGLLTALFGMGFFWDVHSLNYYYTIQVLAGIFQSTGWPSVVSVMGHWFGKSKRGLIMGIWNAHTSVGNIAGTFMASKLLSSGWGNSFVVPGVLMAGCGVLVYFFLAVHPEDVGHGEKSSAADPGGKKDSRKSVGFAAALKIPGVIPFSLCLFFSKLVAYTFLYWLPFYIRNTPIGGETLSAEAAGDLSVLFDIGGVFGGVAAGYLSDRFNARSIVSSGFVLVAIPVLYMYREYGAVNMTTNVALMMLAGVFVNGPYALITTAVSADLGTHESLKGNAQALATVTAIIDGTGSLGAAVGPALTGWLSQIGDGWTNVFYMLYMAALIAGLLLMRLVYKEVMQISIDNYDSIEKERLLKEVPLHSTRVDTR